MFASEETNMLVTQHTSVWHQERQYGVTSSRCYDIFTYSKHVWEMKSMKYFWPKKFTNKYVRHGAQQASHARNCFKKLYSVNVVEFDFITSHSNPWLGVSPDGVIFHENEPVGILEIKCHFEGAVKPIEELLEAIKYIQKKNENTYVLKENHKYYAQVQLCMAVLNLNICKFVLLHRSICTRAAAIFVFWMASSADN